jgi:hypothetical protein
MKTTIMETMDIGEIDANRYNPEESILKNVKKDYWSVHSLYMLRSVVVHMYGNTIYKTKDEACKSALKDFAKQFFKLKKSDKDLFKLIKSSSITFLAVKQGATDLTDPAQAGMLEVGFLKDEDIDHMRRIIKKYRKDFKEANKHSGWITDILSMFRRKKNLGQILKDANFEFGDPCYFDGKDWRSFETGGTEK